MKKFIIALLSFITLSLAAQEQDPKAKGILDEVSKVSKTYKTTSANFTRSNFNKDKKLVEKQDGKIQVKGQKFKLEIPGNVIVCDGKTIWNHNKDANEVTIKNFDTNNEDQLNPTKIFTIYETGYKYKYDKEEKAGGVMCHVIDLYPAVKPEKKKFHTLKLYIDKIKKTVVQLKSLMRDQSTEVYEIKSFKANADISDAVFAFDTSKFKPDQINDERD